MTPEERAEKIGDRFIADFRAEVAAKETLDFIAAQIREAVEEATSAGYFGEIILAKMVRAKAEAYEDAAKIAEGLKDTYKDAAVGYHLGSAHMCLVEIPNAIRARKDEVCK